MLGVENMKTNIGVGKLSELDVLVLAARMLLVVLTRTRGGRGSCDALDSRRPTPEAPGFRTYTPFCIANDCPCRCRCLFVRATQPVMVAQGSGVWVLGYTYVSHVHNIPKISKVCNAVLCIAVHRGWLVMP